ncbi:hypothetical protein PAXINDRAFT_12598 [Paxillus involutus ATCC 200175]|uniref:Uncharacterized protein n=1 Tax=Paxillus involutus ATCC 200175 TaxID=664439 RepID=A0A0C9SXL9_PAXIN|nr:hypothetical protein PAXINDRAFT_12598 [Paxillus involutus ATCC 200175]
MIYWDDILQSKSNEVGNFGDREDEDVNAMMQKTSLKEDEDNSEGEQEEEQELETEETEIEEWEDVVEMLETGSILEVRSKPDGSGYRVMGKEFRRMSEL